MNAKHEKYNSLNLLINEMKHHFIKIFVEHKYSSTNSDCDKLLNCNQVNY